MELPAGLRASIDALLDGVSTDRLARAAATLSERYRAELRDGRFHVDGEEAALAYLASRLPATYAATRAALGEAAARLSGLAPATQLDFGSGPGTAVFAAADLWPTLAAATLVEGSAAMRRKGEHLAAGDGLARRWLSADLAAAPPVIEPHGLEPHDLVTIAYVLDELEPGARRRLVDAAWKATGRLLVVVEPGTPAGWQRITELREQLLGAGAHLAAPCPHDLPCPLVPPDWCHFAARLPRSRLHLRTKQASAPFEDEKYIYLAASRTPADDRPARILAPPRQASGRTTLKLCRPDGHAGERLVTRREGDAFRIARRAGWGDAITLEQGGLE